MKRHSLVLLLGSLCAVSAALATTYVRVEKDGSKTYSDRPIPGGQPVELQPAQTYSAPPASSLSTASGRTREEQALQQVDDFRYESCSISPENDTTFQSPESVPVSVSTSPPLRSGDLVTITIDGQAAAPGSTNTVLAPAYRGTHSVGVSVTNTAGKTVCTSSSVFHVQQPGVNSPARQARPSR